MSFADQLRVGGHRNSLGDAVKVLEAVLTDQSRLDELYACISHEDAWVRMRAIDTFEKVGREHPGWLEPYIDDLLNEVSKVDQPSIQWHLAEIFCEVRLSDTQRSKAIDLLKTNIATVNVDWIVAANTMTALVHFVKTGHISPSEAIRLLEVQQDHHSNAVKKRAAKLLNQISEL